MQPPVGRTDRKRLREAGQRTVAAVDAAVAVVGDLARHGAYGDAVAFEIGDAFAHHGLLARQFDEQRARTSRLDFGAQDVDAQIVTLHQIVGNRLVGGVRREIENYFGRHVLFLVSGYSSSAFSPLTVEWAGMGCTGSVRRNSPRAIQPLSVSAISRALRRLATEPCARAAPGTSIEPLRSSA